MKVEVIYINNRPEPGLHITAETKEEKFLLGMLHYIRFESKKNIHLGIYRSYNSEEGIDAIDIHYREFSDPDPYLLPRPIDVYLDRNMADPQMQQLIYGPVSEVNDEQPSNVFETPTIHVISNIEKKKHDTGKKLSKNQKQAAGKAKVMIPCPVCKTPFEEKPRTKYCSKKCAKSVSNANYKAKHPELYVKTNLGNPKIIQNHGPIDPPAAFEPDPEPSGEYDSPF
jgi:hypothetical protein